jgi:hypothetical protein
VEQQAERRSCGCAFVRHHAAEVARVITLTPRSEGLPNGRGVRAWLQYPVLYIGAAASGQLK